MSQTEDLLASAHRRGGEALGQISLALASRKVSRHTMERSLLLLERACADLRLLLERT